MHENPVNFALSTHTLPTPNPQPQTTTPNSSVKAQATDRRERGQMVKVEVKDDTYDDTQCLVNGVVIHKQRQQLS